MNGFCSILESTSYCMNNDLVQVQLIISGMFEHSVLCVLESYGLYGP